MRKKTLSIVAALFMCACGAWAQTTDHLATFNFSASALTEGSTTAEITENGVKVTVSTPVSTGLASGTSTYSLTDAQITSLNSNVNATSAFTNDIAQSYISAGAKNANAD